MQKYVQQVKQSVEQSQRKKEEPSRKVKKSNMTCVILSFRVVMTLNFACRSEKRRKLEQQKELDALFALTIKQPKVPPGVDPKTILCEFFRHGKCTKSFKCKFSHDFAVERKGPKVDLYSDKRDITETDEGMEGMGPGNS